MERPLFLCRVFGRFEPLGWSVPVAGFRCFGVGFVFERDSVGVVFRCRGDLFYAVSVCVGSFVSACGMLCGGGGAVKWRLCIPEKGLRFWSAFPQKGDRRMIPIKARESLFGCPGASRVCGAGRSIGSAGCVSGRAGWRMWGFVGCGGFLCFSGLARRFRFTGGFFAREMGSGAAVF